MLSADYEEVVRRALSRSVLVSTCQGLTSPTVWARVG